MSQARFLVGDVFDVMATLPDDSFDLVLTSPPFLALRSYLPADHPNKGKEIGSEPTPAAFIDTLLALTAEWDRLLAPHGSICIELGDTYAGNGGAGGDWSDSAATTKARVAGGSLSGPPRRQTLTGWPLDKSLALIPELYRLALAYGVNPLTGQPSPAGQWRVRNVVRWHRPNPPVGALGDKYRPATSDMVIATKSRTRYFDLDAVREGVRTVSDASRTWSISVRAEGDDRGERSVNRVDGGAPPLDTWIIPTHPYKGAHYATWPPALLERPIKSMVPERVCLTCGEPSRRISETERITNGAVATEATPLYQPGRASNGGGDYSATGGASYGTSVTTVGWTDCGCPSYVCAGQHGYGCAGDTCQDTHYPIEKWRRGHVLDPFGGSGTTAAVATGHGRDCTLIDIDERNADLARDRIGMFLEVA